MAEPTLKNVLEAIAQIRNEMATKVDLARVGVDLARVEANLARVEAKVDTHRAETTKGFAELDAELTRHAESTAS